MINIKARYEILHNISLNENVLVESRCHEKLETVLMKLKDKNENLFWLLNKAIGNMIKVLL